MEYLRPAEWDANNGLGEKNLPAIAGDPPLVPSFIAAGGERAGFAFIDFFTAQIRNHNTRAESPLADQHVHIAKPSPPALRRVLA
jgi:hypothetical protein